MRASADAWVSTSNVPVGTPRYCSTTGSTAAEKYGAARPVAAWRAGYQTRTGSVLGLPVAGSMRDVSGTNPERTPIGSGPVGGGSASCELAATAAGASGVPDAALPGQAAPAAAGATGSNHAETNAPARRPTHRARLPARLVGYLIATSLS